MTWAREALGFESDPWQADVLRSATQRMLLLCCRQSGKSTTTALAALHVAMYQPGVLVLLLSPSLRQSGELFRKVIRFYGALADMVPSEAESALRLELQNGSRVVSLPGLERTVRGYSGVDLLIIDEAARVPDDLYYSVRPMLAVSGGRLIGLSTPFGKRGWFHQEWTGANPWGRVMITAQDCPRISAEFLAEEQAGMPESWFRQEYLCEFMDGTLQYFRTSLIERIFEGDARPLWKQADTLDIISGKVEILWPQAQAQKSR